MDDNTMSFIMELIKKLLLMIFKKFEVDKEFDALGFNVENMLNGTTEAEEQD